jgi:hypothetical protein
MNNLSAESILSDEQLDQVAGGAEPKPRGNLRGWVLTVLIEKAIEYVGEKLEDSRPFLHPGPGSN